MKKRFSITLYNLPQFSTLVGSIRHGRRIEGCERDYKILPCILPYGSAIKRLFNFDPIKISAGQTDALAKLKSEACPFSGQVVMGRIYKILPCILPYGSAIKRLLKFVPSKFSLWCLSFFAKERHSATSRKQKLWITKYARIFYPAPFFHAA